MRLDTLVAAADLPGAGVQVLEVRGDPRTAEIATMALDSRRVEPGALYCCVPGRTFNGHDFAPAAVDAGAVALLCERPLEVAVPQIVVRPVRRALGPLA
ncbi:MAG TPA: Mur ligase domain-containing protein, partial [Acidimicrobiales bacterium]|nr:Mur ligase domain-containing protein [Acidimicrobiales bacterium]